MDMYQYNLCIYIYIYIYIYICVCVCVCVDVIRKQHFHFKPKHVLFKRNNIMGVLLQSAFSFCSKVKGS